MGLSCGGFSITVRTGFFNANPQGELGAADDFAEISIQRGSRTIQLQMSPNDCPEPVGRCHGMLPNNVYAIEGRSTAQGFELMLTKSVCDANYKCRTVEEVVRL
jgi:hypothetical protein